ncbi:hypothetical protein KAM334_15230 [Aeromonas caviae]|nr:hypothetical protein KAM334_15230 [Aeromonas caviae]
MQIPHYPPADEGGQDDAQQHASRPPPEVTGTPDPHLFNPLEELLIETNADQLRIH